MHIVYKYLLPKLFLYFRELPSELPMLVGSYVDTLIYTFIKYRNLI